VQKNKTARSTGHPETESSLAKTVLIKPCDDDGADEGLVLGKLGTKTVPNHRQNRALLVIAHIA
jgi:hypothetical protein